MALKGDRHILETDISFRMFETATRGGMTFYDQGGSGAALDQSVARVTYDPGSAGGSGVAEPAGLLLTDVVNVDTTRQKINHYKEETNVGGKVTLMTRGWVVTNMISSGSPSVGATCYADFGATSSGQNLTPVFHATGGLAARPIVGQWKSSVDEDGYAKVFVNIPSSNSVQF